MASHNTKCIHKHNTFWCYRRYVHDKMLFKRLVAAAHDIPDTRWEIGGNAAVMANRMTVEGCKVLLGSVMTSAVVKEMEPGIKGQS